MGIQVQPPADRGPPSRRRGALIGAGLGSLAVIVALFTGTGLLAACVVVAACATLGALHPRAVVRLWDIVAYGTKF